MKNLILVLSFMISGTVCAQTVTTSDSIKPLEKKTLQANEKLDQYLDLNTARESVNSLKARATVFDPVIVEDLPSVNLGLPPLDVYLGPPVESNTFTRNPFANDYSYYSGMDLSDDLWFTSSSIQRTYPLLGSVRSVNLNLNYQPTEWLVISGGTYGAKYHLGGNAYNDVGANGALKFILHDRVRVNGYGQYSVNQKTNHVQGPMMGMFPQTYYGGSLELKITEKFGVEGGIIRELNPFNGKWVNRTFIAPVFYKSR
ncbi:MAG: hypothetical protein LBV43_12465 [Prevotella sp.]|jgi:hypothetical protein|nr:hypothetical protein [Prevotella sp.]